MHFIDFNLTLIISSICLLSRLITIAVALAFLSWNKIRSGGALASNGSQIIPEKMHARV